MKTIIFEGPDEAGKSTLINATAKVLDNVGLPFSVVKSPAGREISWDPEWERWSDTQGLKEKHDARTVFLLDRTPEISEFVYGILRQKTRLSNPLEVLHRFRLGQKMMVLCLPRQHLNTTQQHFDPYGNDVGYKSAGQHLLYLAVDQLLRLNTSKDFHYMRWNRFDKLEDVWAHYLVRIGAYIGLEPLDLKSTFYSKPADFFPSRETAR